MTPDVPPLPDPIAPARPVRIRKRKRRHGESKILRNLWLPALLLAAIAAIWGVGYLSHLKPPGQIAGYIASTEILAQEYSEYEGKPLRDLGPAQEFQRAALLAEKGDFKGAIGLLETISKLCAEPVVFHDLGILYAQTNDHDRALKAFREALARDPGYAPVRLVLNSLRGFTPHEADPVTAESEPNGTYLTANLISLGVDVVGEISAPNDVDCYRLSAPPAPRDILRVEIVSQSVTLAPRITIYDDLGSPTGATSESPDPGAGVSLPISPQPNSTLYVEVAGNRGTQGAYALKVTAARSFDRFEPNDEIAAAHPIVVGQTIDANIMTGEDTDFYSFVADRTGKMVVTLQGQSKSLIPALTTFGPDRQPIQYAVDGVGAGAKLTRSIDVEEHQVYYVEVWGQAKSSGAYALSVQ
jgi:hypothetical protein